MVWSRVALQQWNSVHSGLYWFGDNESELMTHLQNTGWNQYIRESNTTEIKKIYDAIRSAQRDKDWNQRSLLPLLKPFRKPWKQVKSGWYILKSNDGFPMHISAIRKNRFSVWLEHADVCENEDDVNRFIDQVNTRHHIAIQLTALHFNK